MMNIEKYVYNSLKKPLNGALFFDRPKTCPKTYITFERVGGLLRDVVIDQATIVFNCCSQSRQESQELADKLDVLVRGLADDDLSQVLRVERSGYAHFWDGLLNEHLYKLTFHFTYYAL